MVYQLYNFGSVCWKHFPEDQPRETLSVINARESIRRIHTLEFSPALLACVFLFLVVVPTVWSLSMTDPYIWVHWPCSAQHSQQLLLSLSLHIRRECGSDPNDQQWTKPKLKTRRKNAQSLFGVIVRANEFGSLFFWYSTREQTINWRIFWQRECAPRCNVIHCWFVANQTTPWIKVMSTAFSRTPLSWSALAKSQAMSQMMTQPNVLTRMCDQYS